MPKIVLKTTSGRVASTGQVNKSVSSVISDYTTALAQKFDSEIVDRAVNESVNENITNITQEITQVQTKRFDELEDVLEGAPKSGMSLIYNEDDDKYVVDYQDLDGGTF